VSKEIPLFAVADKPFVYFQCQMNLIEMEGGGNAECPRPKCSATSVAEKRTKEKTPLAKTKRSFLDGDRVSPFGDRKKVEVLDAVTNRIDILPYDSTTGFAATDSEEPSAIVGDGSDASNEDEWNAAKNALLGSGRLMCFSRELLLVAASLAILVGKIQRIERLLTIAIGLFRPWGVCSSGH